MPPQPLKRQFPQGAGRDGHRALGSNLYTPSQVRVIEANRQRLQVWMTHPPL